MTETPDSEYFDVTAVPVDAEYKECDAFEDLGVSTLRPAYNVRLTVKKTIPAYLPTHDVNMDVDVSETFLGTRATSYREICTLHVACICLDFRVTKAIHLPGKGNHI